MNNIVKNDNKLYLQCSCASEVMLVERDDEIDSYFIAIFDRANVRSWSNKFRQIWHIIRYGEPYSDHIVLDKENIEQLEQFIKQTKD